MHVVAHYVSFLDPAFFLLSQSARGSAEMLAQFTVECLSSSFECENDVIFAIPL